MTSPVTFVLTQKLLLQATSSAKLLVLLGNCRYIRKQVLPALASEYSNVLSSNEPYITDEVPRVTLLESTFEELEEQLIDTYVGTVTSKLKKMVRQTIEEEKVDFPKPIEVTNISDCPMEWIHHLIEVQVGIKWCLLCPTKGQDITV